MTLLAAAGPSWSTRHSSTVTTTNPLSALSDFDFIVLLLRLLHWRAPSLLLEGSAEFVVADFHGPVPYPLQLAEAGDQVALLLLVGSSGARLCACAKGWPR